MQKVLFVLLLLLVASGCAGMGKRSTAGSAWSNGQYIFEYGPGFKVNDRDRGVELWAENETFVALVISSSKPDDMHGLAAEFLRNHRMRAEVFELVKQEDVAVSGGRVNFSHVRETVKGESVVILSYVHAGPKGSIIVTTAADAKVESYVFNDMMRVLDGLSFR
jgi:hypothetical protein